MVFFWYEQLNLEMWAFDIFFKGVILHSRQMGAPASHILSGPSWVNHAYCIILHTEGTSKDVLNLSWSSALLSVTPEADGQ